MKASRNAPAAVAPPPAARLWLNAALAGLWLSGGAWLICRYFLRVPDDWGPAPHPLEPWLMRVHGGFAFAMLWTIGFLWGVHVLGAWASGRRRATGAILLAWLAVQGLTAYLLLWGPGDDGAWGAVSLVHWIAGLTVPAAYLIHRFFRRRRR